MAEPIKWTFQDYVEKKCLLSQVDLPKPTNSTARDLARQYAPDAIRTLIRLMDSAEDSVALKAANALLDRGFGRPETTVTNQGTIEHHHEWPEWLTARRLAYQEAAQLAPDILDVESVPVPRDDDPPLQ